MSTRKVGVGFNHTRVLHDGRQGWRERYDLMRRLTRLPRRIDRKIQGRMPISSSVTETMRIMMRG